MVRLCCSLTRVVFFTVPAVREQILIIGRIRGKIAFFLLQI